MAVTPIVISHSELDAIRQCGHKADLAFRQHWSPLVVGPALNTGRIWHKVLEEHYRAIQVEATDHARLKAVADYLTEIEADDSDTAQLVAWMYAGHCELYGLDEGWEIIGVEETRFIRLPTTTGRASRYYLRMRADLIVRDRGLQLTGSQTGAPGKLWLVDHKSGQNLPTEKELDLDDQFGLYTWGLRKEGLGIFGSVYSAARTQRNKTTPQPLEERFSRTRLYRTDRELETIAREAFATARAHYRYAENEAPRAPDTSPIGPHRCRYKCPFTEPCLMGRKAGTTAERQFLSAGGFEQLSAEQHWIQRGYPAAGQEEP